MLAPRSLEIVHLLYHWNGSRREFLSSTLQGDESFWLQQRWIRNEYDCQREYINVSRCYYISFLADLLLARIAKCISLVIFT